MHRVQGADPMKLNKALTDFGYPVGSITLADEVGIDVAAKVGRESPQHTRLQPLAHTVTASGTHGYSLWHTRLQPLAHMVTPSGTYGYSL